MAEFTTQTNLMKLWEQSDQTSERLLKKILSKTLDTIGQEDGQVAAKIGGGGTLDGPVMRWMEEQDYPTAVTGQLSDYAGTPTLTISGNLQGAAVTQTSIQRVIRVGTIVQRESDGATVKLSSISGITDGSAPWVATGAAYGNTTLSNDSSPVTWTIIAEAASDYKEISDTRTLDRTFREVGTQIFWESFQIPHTRKNTAYENVPNELEHQMAALLRKLHRQREYALLRGVPYYSSGYKYGNATQESTMLGLSHWPVVVQAEAADTSTYVNLSDADITKTNIDDVIRNLWMNAYADYSQGDWWIVTTPKVHEQIHEFDSVYRQTERTDKTVGYAVDRFAAKAGTTFPILSNRYMRQGTLLLVNFKSCSRGSYKNDTVWRKEIPTKGRFQEWIVSFQEWGTMVRKPRQIGMIYNINED